MVNLQGERCFNWGVACNQTGPGWRRWLAQHLRGMAWRLDGRYTLGLEITSSERLSPGTEREVITAGIQHMQRHLGVVTKLAAVEHMMAEQRPDLVQTQP